MKTVLRYFDKDGKELDPNTVTTERASKVGKVKGDGQKAVWIDSFSVYVSLGPSPRAWNDYSNAVLVARKIEYKTKPKLHKCDARCRNAKGRTCECECGGKNHGAGN